MPRSESLQESVISNRSWVSLIFVCLMSGCTSTLPPAPQALTRAPNCADVRSGNIVWKTTRPITLERSVAQQSAIDETLMELVKQLTGTEIISLIRSDQTRKNESFSDQFQVANFARVKGRILDYDIINIRHHTADKTSLFRIELRGRVCADDLVETPMIVALRNTSDLPIDVLDELESALSRHLAANPRLMLADQDASKTYNDIDIDIAVEHPQSQVVDRRNAISAIQGNLGRRAADGIALYATQVTLRITLRANLHEDGTTLVSTQQVERELPGSEQLSPNIVAEMQSEAATIVARELARTLSEHIKKRDL